MISHKYKVIFYHIPKAAGTSVEKAFMHFSSHEHRDVQDHRNPRNIQPCFSFFDVLSSRENISEYLKRTYYKFRKVTNHNNKNKVSRLQYESYIKFTIVRNPWSRCYSWYKNLIRDDVHLKRYGFDKKVTFEEFLYKSVGKGPLRPQTFWLKDFSGNLNVDRFIKFENLEQEFKEFSDAYNLGVQIPHELKTNNDDYRKHYNKQMIEHVALYYKEEVELFNYSFNL